MPDRLDAEDILQDVFSELVTAYRLVEPLEQVGAWLYRVARNRIIDRFRRRRFERPGAARRAPGPEEPGAEESPSLEDLLPSPDAGPEAAYARAVLVEELDRALAELPDEQRAVFVAHEIDGRTFREIADETGINRNTLLSRKRYAVQHLRRRLAELYAFARKG